VPFLQQSLGEAAVESKKPRRSQRILSQSQDFDAEIKQAQLPSPLTHKDTTATEEFEDGTITPPSQRPSQFAHPANVRSPLALGLSSPPSDTQPFSQFVYPPQALSYEVQDEEG
jgi:serine/threonine-protein kinase Chk2